MSQWLVSTPLRATFKNLEGFRSGLGNWQSVGFGASALLGAVLSSQTGGTFGAKHGVSAGEAFVGGFLALLGSRCEKDTIRSFVGLMLRQYH